MEVGLKLTKPETVSEAQYPYQRLIGSLMYLAVATEPNIAYAVNSLSQFNTCYTSEHWMAAKSAAVLERYSRARGILFERTGKPLLGYADADWASCAENRRTPDLGGNARDVLAKGYPFGLFKLDVKTSTETGVQFKIGGVYNLKTERAVASLNTSYKFKEYGVVFTEKWNTDNVLQSEIAYEDRGKDLRLACMSSVELPRTRGDAAEGSTASVGGSARNIRTSDSYEKKLLLNGNVRNSLCSVEIESEFKNYRPVMHGGIVFGHRGWFVGCQSFYDDGASPKFHDLKVAMGFATREFVITAGVNKGREFTASIYQAISDRMETALMVNWTQDRRTSELAIGCRYVFKRDATCRLKIDSKGRIGLAASTKLQKGITLSLAVQLDGKDFWSGEHRSGISLELESSG